VPEPEAYEEATDLYAKLMDIHRVLTDPASSSIRLVVNPERMVIEESQRAYTSLQLFGYAVDAVIVNRVLPEEGVGPLFTEYLADQRRYLSEIEQAFPRVPVFQIPHTGKEARGIALLSEIGRALYDGRDPASFFSRERPFRLSAQNGTYVLEMHLPFLGSGDVSVLQYGSELVVQVRNQRRSIFLPKFLGFYSAKDARLEEGWLRVRFEKADGES
jgi:arsenite-transporting ATPase